jgi:glutamate dehydrogenase (NAD(P)+)
LSSTSVLEQLQTETLRPRLVIEVNHETMGKIGYVVIDRTVHYAAFGPVRFVPDVSVDELALNARTMTRKWAFVSATMGGAMASISVNPEALGYDRLTLMETFGRSISALVKQHMYYPGADMGVTLDDLKAIMEGAGRPLVSRQIDSSFYTALTVFETVRQVVKFNGRQLANLEFALEGFGKVGAHFAHLMAQAGAKLVALTTSQGGIMASEGLDISQLLTLKEKFGGKLVHHYPKAQAITQEALFTQPVDLIVPGAHPEVIHSGNAPEIKAHLIVPISNAPVTLEAENILNSRGITVIPDFMANCGGVLAVDMRGAGFEGEDVTYMVEQFFSQIILRVLQHAQQTGQPVAEVARAVAWLNHRRLNGLVDIPVASSFNKKAMFSKTGFSQVSQRVAWRLHRRWPRLSKPVRRAALERFAEWKVGPIEAILAQLHQQQ